MAGPVRGSPWPHSPGPAPWPRAPRGPSSGRLLGLGVFADGQGEIDVAKIGVLEDGAGHCRAVGVPRSLCSVWLRAHQARAFDWEPTQRIALGPAVMIATQTGRTHDCTRLFCTDLKTTLAEREPSTHDPRRKSMALDAQVRIPNRGRQCLPPRPSLPQQERPAASCRALRNRKIFGNRRLRLRDVFLSV